MNQTYFEGQKSDAGISQIINFFDQYLVKISRLIRKYIRYT
jgi:hypothetical protein